MTKPVQRQLIGTAPESTSSAANFFPCKMTLSALRKAAAACEACPLYLDATQTVFGEGPSEARLVLVGETPGDQEDLQRKPFVGPAGRLLDDVLLKAGLNRSEVYVTNAVKHFKWEPRGKRRVHKKPSARERAACHPWLEAELNALKPHVIVCLGATAAQAIFRAAFRVTRQRGEVLQTATGAKAIATHHSSAMLRAAEASARQRMRQELAADLSIAASLLERSD